MRKINRLRKVVAFNKEWLGAFVVFPDGNGEYKAYQYMHGFVEVPLNGVTNLDGAISVVSMLDSYQIRDEYGNITEDRFNLGELPEQIPGYDFV